MKDLIKNKYFYIGLIVSAFAVLGVSTITFNLLDKVEPSLDTYVDGAYISKSKKYVKEIQQVCESTPDKEYLLVAFIGSTMEIIIRVDSYKNWRDEYTDKLERCIKLTLMRGGHSFALMPLQEQDKGSLVIQ